MNTNNILNNLILMLTDSYKQSHFGFMEDGTTSIFSYIEARKGGLYTFSQFFGLQIFLKEYFLKPFTMEMVDQAEEFLTEHGLPFNRKGWEYIINNHSGFLPLKIKAVREGTIVPEGNVLVTVENTDPNCAWLTSYFETALLRAAWYGTTVATRGYSIKQIIKEYMELTNDVDCSEWKLVDFGARGVSSLESSQIAAAHLLNFIGSDNIASIAAAMHYYNEDNVLGFSIPASEHSVTCAFGEDREEDFISHAIDVYGGKGKLISLVADSYDLKNFVKIIGTTLKPKILDNGCTIVVRPDSGEPHEVVLSTVEQLDSYYGHTVNSKGYKILHPSVRVIQGDGIGEDAIRKIYETLTAAGYGADNVTFGCGGYLLQQLNRDTLRFAMKASHVVVNGEGRDIFKMPKTDPTKASKRGRLTLVKTADGEIKTVNENEVDVTMTELLETVYVNGNLIRDLTFSEIKTY